MYLKKVYKEGSVAAGAPQVTHVKVLRAKKRFHFPTKLVDQAAEEGWLTIDPKVGGEIRITTAEGEPDLVYTIERTPGWYCCFDMKRFPDGASARQYVQLAFAGKRSPDSNNPAGYERIHFYDAVRKEG